MLYLIHRIGRAWFYLCTGYSFVVLLAGKGNGIVLYALKHGAVWMFLIVSVVAATVFRRLGKRANKHEHPITTNRVYNSSGGMSSLFGGLIGLASAGVYNSGYPVLWIAAGSFIGGALTQLLIHPLLYAAERLLPSSRRHRAARLALVKTYRREAVLAKQRALAELEANEAKKLEMWNDVLTPKARELASLLITGPASLEANRGKIVDMGIEAWQIGGAGCMRHLHSMAVDVCKQEHGDANTAEFIAPCWEGIGQW